VRWCIEVSLTSPSPQAGEEKRAAANRFSETVNHAATTTINYHQPRSLKQATKALAILGPMQCSWPAARCLSENEARPIYARHLIPQSVRDLKGFAKPRTVWIGAAKA